MTTKPKKPVLPPRLEKRQNVGGKNPAGTNPLGKNPLGKLLSKLPGLKGLASSQKQKGNQTLSAHKSAALEKAAKTLTVKPQKLAAGGAAKVRLGQVKVKGVGSSFKTLPKAKKKS
jgi:hypothetical protein